MRTNTAIVCAAALCCFGLLGCVSTDTYKVKEQEVQALSKNNQDMQEQNKGLLREQEELRTKADTLARENEGLKDQVQKLSSASEDLKAQAGQLGRDNEGIRAQVQTLTRKIEDLQAENEKLAAMTRPENLLRTLGDQFNKLQKQIEALRAENEMAKKSQAAPRDAAGGEGDRLSEPAKGEVVPATTPSEGSQEEKTREAQPQPAADAVKSESLKQ